VEKFPPSSRRRGPQALQNKYPQETIIQNNEHGYGKLHIL